MDVEYFSAIFNLLSSVVTAFGLPFAIATFIYQKRKEQKASESDTFDQLDDAYVSFLRLCLDNADLDIFDKPIGKNYHPTDEQLRREGVIFAILISLLERAHMMFKDQSHEFRHSQWEGWVHYAKTYISRENFLREWNKIGHTFDKEFYSFMKDMVSQPQK